MRVSEKGRIRPYLTEFDDFRSWADSTPFDRHHFTYVAPGYGLSARLQFTAIPVLHSVDQGKTMWFGFTEILAAHQMVEHEPPEVQGLVFADREAVHPETVDFERVADVGTNDQAVREWAGAARPYLSRVEPESDAFGFLRWAKVNEWDQRPLSSRNWTPGNFCQITRSCWSLSSTSFDPWREYFRARAHHSQDELAQYITVKDLIMLIHDYLLPPHLNPRIVTPRHNNPS